MSPFYNLVSYKESVIHVLATSSATPPYCNRDYYYANPKSPSLLRIPYLNKTQRRANGATNTPPLLSYRTLSIPHALYTLCAIEDVQHELIDHSYQLFRRMFCVNG